MGESFTPISFRIDPDLWREFRAKAITEQLKTRELLEKLMRDWLKRTTR